jgi:glyoxylase-like metal-dependent hydrolase (beta-lactamase superfamily II)
VNGFPFIDFSSGGNVDGYVRTIEAVLKKIPTDAKIIPGHGKLSTHDDLKNYHAMLVETIGLVRKQIAEGKSLEAIKAAGLPEKYRSLGSGFINANRWIEAIHRGTPKQ